MQYKIHTPATITDRIQSSYNLKQNLCLNRLRFNRMATNIYFLKC